MPESHKPDLGTPTSEEYSKAEQDERESAKNIHAALKQAQQELNRAEDLFNVYKDRKFLAKPGITLDVREVFETAHENAVSLIDKLFEGLKRMLVVEESLSQDSTRDMES